MKIKVQNNQDCTSEIIEMPCLPREGEQFETRSGVILQVLRITHTPFATDVTARMVVGVRISLGLD